MRNAVLAGVVLSREPVTRHSLGAEVAERYAGVLVSWDAKHSYDHVKMLAESHLVEPISARKPSRWRASPAGVEGWRAWLVSPIPSRDPLRHALARLRSCLDHDYTTMNVIIDLLEEETMRMLERPAGPADSPLTVLLAHSAQRNSAVSILRWCQEARDEIAARAAALS